MTILELIEEGLINQDWSFIKKARQVLKSGQSANAEAAKVMFYVDEEIKIEPQVRPKKKAGRPKKTRLIAPVEPDEPQEQDIPTDVEPEIAQARPSKRLPFKRPTKNQFVDDLKMCAEDIELDNRCATKKPEPRRPPSKNVKVICHICGKKEEVPPLLAPKMIGSEESFYKCNSCIGGK